MTLKTLNYQHIYSVLRSAMVDRDRDITMVIEDVVLIPVGKTEFALKKDVPSGALLISYMMLFYPNFIRRCADDKNWVIPALPWLGGRRNKKMPLFEDELLVGIALAIGKYAGILEVYTHDILDQIVIRANTLCPMVIRTMELIEENNLGLDDARELFISLMQDDEYRLFVSLADDYVANTSWIIEDSISADTNVNERIDLSKTQPSKMPDFGPPDFH
ncbi:hypothetical protein ACK8P5_26040 (plasmid) [Paenibacillus sp. EC2-1]|uniref:hypothetical protein n=1 Tax=Paenibacillus sp. EC2-1 TaxID=3388665 RepID=UPI003BEEF418